MIIGNFQKTCGVKIQIGIWQTHLISLNKKLDQKNLEDWEKFTKELVNIEDKELNLIKKKEQYFQRIDLHGLNLLDANKKIENIINQAHLNNIIKIIVITGKGKRSKNKSNPYISEKMSILKNSVPDFLKNSYLIKKISKISPASREDGGDGAFYIYLKKNKDL